MLLIFFAVEGQISMLLMDKRESVSVSVSVVVSLFVRVTTVERRQLPWLVDRTKKYSDWPYV